MASSTLDPDNIPEPDRRLGRGHGTSALGPSDISDTGSDVQGETRLSSEVDIGLDKGTTSDPDSAPRDLSAGPDIGDAGLDSDTDAVGTGEHKTAGRDLDIEAGADIDVDRIESIDLDDPDLLGETEDLPRRIQSPRQPPQQRR